MPPRKKMMTGAVTGAVLCGLSVLCVSILADATPPTRALEKQSLDEILLDLCSLPNERIFIGDAGVVESTNCDIIRLLLRTRRFNQAVQLIVQADDAEKAGIATGITSVLSWVGHEEQGLMATLDGTVESAAMNDLIYGDPDAADLSARRYGIDGIELGLTSNCYLLGLCGKPQHMGVLLPIAAQGSRHGYGLKLAAVDAMDRMMMRVQGDTTLSMEAQTTVTEYAAWRTNRGLPSRITADMFAYNAPGTPYTLLGAVGGAPATMAGKIELPLYPASYTGSFAVFDHVVMEDPEKLREYNELHEMTDVKDRMIVEDPRRGLTREDMKYIAAQAQRLVEAIGR